MAGACLDPRLLSDYLAGRTSGPAVNAVIEEHLQECEKCQARAAQHRPHRDSLYQALAQVGSLKVASVEPELVGALSAIASMQPAGAGQELPGRPGAGQFIRDYQLLEKLGEGGMGSVYLAMHTWLDKPVAVKLLKSDRNQDPQAVSRFEREMRAVGKLEHPHIVRALDAGQENGVHFLVMEYVSGVDLSGLVQRLGPLAVADACELIRQAALGLHHAHENDLIHRDVKPSNLMLTIEGQLKVLDLGLAQFRASIRESVNLTADNQVLGTLLYISPEQFAPNGQVDARSDIYSLGVTLCELLLGAGPLRRGLSPAIAFQAPAAPARRDVPDAVWSLVQRMTARDKESRPATMHSVAEALAPWASGADPEGLMRRLAATAPENRAECREASSASAAQTQSTVRPGTKVFPPPLPGILEPPIIPPRPTALAVVPPSSLRPERRAPAVQRWQIAAALVLLVGCVGMGIGVARAIFRGKQVPGVPLSRVQSAKPGILLVNPESMLVDSLIREGAIVAQSHGESEPIVLVTGDNELTAGQYTVKCLAKDVSIEPMEINVAANHTLEMPPLEVAYAHWKYPSLPAEPGSFCQYEGHITLGSGPPMTYGIRLSAHGTVVEHDRQFRWLQIDLTSDQAVLEETALLLIDVVRWETEHTLAIDRGWLTASGPRIRKQLAEYKAKDPETRLVAKFNRDDDTLAQIASGQGILLEPQRLTIQDALALLFGDSAPRAADWARQLRSLMPSQPQLSRELVPTSKREVRCLVVRGWGQVPEEHSFELTRNEKIPFNFVTVEARGPQFHAILKADNWNVASSIVADEVALDSAYKRLAASAARPRPFERAAFPADDGRQVQYEGKIKIAGGQELTYTALVRVVGSEKVREDVGRWLEMEVTSQKMGAKRHREAARLLVNQTRYENDRKFVVEKGTFYIGDQDAFDWNNGNLKQAQEGLWLLERPLPGPQERFGVHDVLTLMFDGPSPATPSLDAIREEFSARIVAKRLDRHYSDIRKTDPLGRGELDVQEWQSPPELMPSNYTIRRCARIPFGFYSANLELCVMSTVLGKQATVLEVTVEAKNYGQAESALDEDLVLATTERIKAVADPNWRLWDVASPELFAEYCGTVKDRVILRCRGEDRFRDYALADLSSEDAAAARQGRLWRGAAGKLLELKSDPGAPVCGEFVRLSPADNVLIRTRTGGEENARVGKLPALLKDFCEADQSVIRELDQRSKLGNKASR